MITVFTGGYGSGKTELSVNYAMYLAGCRSFDSAAPRSASGESVTLVDLDVVKPYFRSRELGDRFATYGIRLLSSLERFEMADLPALSPAIQPLLRRNEGEVVVDLAGDRAGARVLHRFVEELTAAQATLYLVANPYRPFSGSAREIAGIAKDLASETGLPLAGLVANPHLIDATSVEDVLSGHEIVAEAAGLLGVPIAFTVVREEFRERVLEAGCPPPVFPVQRFVLPPWEESPVGRAGPPFRRNLT